MTPNEEVKFCETIIRNAKRAQADAVFRRKEAEARIREIKRMSKMPKMSIGDLMEQYSMTRGGLGRGKQK